MSSKANLERIGEKLVNFGIVNLEAQATFMALVYSFCRCEPIIQSCNYRSKAELVADYPIAFGSMTDEQLKNWLFYEDNKKPIADFYDYALDPMKDGRTVGNDYGGDGFKYAPAGLLPIVGKNQYTHYQKIVSKESAKSLGSASDLISSLDASIEVACMLFLERMKGVPQNLNPQFFYEAKRRFPNLVTKDTDAYYEHFYGTKLFSSFGTTDKMAGSLAVRQNYYGSDIYENEFDGFSDPSGKYPYNRERFESTVSKLTYGDKTNSIVTKKDSERNVNIPIANDGGFWSQPKSAYSAKYPYNNVRESESGHVEEWDDTPGAERLHRYHRSGTFEEIDHNGTVVRKIVGDDYVILERNGFIDIVGNANVTVSGNVNVYCLSDANVQVEGSANMKVGGNMDIGVAKDFNLSAEGNISLWSNGSFHIGAKKNGHVLAQKEMFVSGTESTHLTSDDKLFVSSSDDMNICAKTDLYMGGQNVDILGNEYLTMTALEGTDLTSGGDLAIMSSGRMDLTSNSDFALTSALSIDLTATSMYRLSSMATSMSSKTYTSISSLADTSVSSVGITTVSGTGDLSLSSMGAVTISGTANSSISSKGIMQINGSYVMINTMPSIPAIPAIPSVPAFGAIGASSASSPSMGTKSVINGMTPPPLGTPMYPNMPPLGESEVQYNEIDVLYDTPEELDDMTDVAKEYYEFRHHQEGIYNTIEGPTAFGLGNVHSDSEPKVATEVMNIDYGTLTGSYRLSEHFTLDMLFDGGFNNPNQHMLQSQCGYSANEIVANLSRLCENVLEKYLDILPNGIAGYGKEWRINSGYRMTKNAVVECPKCGNSIVECSGGKCKCLMCQHEFDKSSLWKSDHEKGMACDIKLIGQSRGAHWDIIQKLEKVANYDQLILEYEGAKSVWIHVGYRQNACRFQTLTGIDHKKFVNGFVAIV